MNCDKNELGIDNIRSSMCLNGNIPLPLVQRSRLPKKLNLSKVYIHSLQCSYQHLSCLLMFTHPLLNCSIKEHSK